LCIVISYAGWLGNVIIGYIIMIVDVEQADAIYTRVKLAVYCNLSEW